MKNSVSDSVLYMLDIAVLKRIGESQYKVMGKVPDFYREMFPEENGRPCPAPWDHSFMLEFFLQDAEMFFGCKREGWLHSGIWQEMDLCNFNQAMSASALVENNGDQYIIIRLLDDDFAQRVRVLQKAREQLVEQRVLNQNLELYKSKSRTDFLTGLLNKEAFLEAMHIEIDRALSTGVDLSVLFLDLDDFKTINDSYGHVVGDKVLSRLGHILKNSLRVGDVACRYGGEEFAVLAPYTTPMQAYLLGEKLRASVAAGDENDIPQVTVSIGCATHINGETKENFIQRADFALYDAKRNGKNQVKVC